MTRKNVNPMPFRPSQPSAIAVRETYETFNARHKAAAARAPDEADLKALEQSIGNRHKR